MQDIRKKKKQMSDPEMSVLYTQHEGVMKVQGREQLL